MYRNSCYCKLKKQLEELKKDIARNYSSDSDLANKVQQISDDLDANSQRDEELTNTVNVHIQEANERVDLDPASTDDIDTLFP